MVIVIAVAGIMAGGGAVLASALLFDPGGLALALIYSLCGTIGAILAMVAMIIRANVRPGPTALARHTACLSNV